MKLVTKYFLLTTVSFIFASSLIADLSNVTFDSSSCVTLSGGGMQEVSVPLPSGWKDGFKNQKMANDIRESVKGFYPVESILAFYYNPKRNTEYVEVRIYDDKPISYEYYKLLRDKYNKARVDGSAKVEYIKMLPGTPDKDVDKRFQLFPSHENDKHSFHYTAVSLDLDKMNIVFSVVSSAFIWIHDRAFIITARTTAINKSKTMDKMTETRYFISNWVDIILKENGCEANDMSNENETNDIVETIDTNNMSNTNDEAPSQSTDDENKEKDSSKSIILNESDNEPSSSKSKIATFIKNMKARAQSIIKRDDQEDELSTTHDDNNTSIVHDEKSTIWQKTIIPGIILLILISIFTYVRKRRG